MIIKERDSQIRGFEYFYGNGIPTLIRKSAACSTCRSRAKQQKEGSFYLFGLCASGCIFLAFN